MNHTAMFVLPPARTHPLPYTEKNHAEKKKKVKDNSVLWYYFFGCRLLPVTALHSENNVRGKNNNKPQTLTDQRLSNWEKIGLGEYLKILLYVQEQHSPELTLLRF